jgi:hypothetical protein
MIDRAITQKIRIARAVGELLPDTTVFFPPTTPEGYIWFEVQDDQCRPVFSCLRKPGVHFSVFEEKDDTELIELLRQWACGADDQSPEPSCDPTLPKTSRRT